MAQRITGADEPAWPDSRMLGRPLRWKPWAAAIVAALFVTGVGHAVWSGVGATRTTCAHVVIDLADDARGGTASPTEAAAQFSGTLAGRGFPRTGWRLVGEDEVRSGGWTVTVTRLGDGTYTAVEAASC